MKTWYVWWLAVMCATTTSALASDAVVSSPTTTRIKGVVYAFQSGGTRVPGAKICVDELPNKACTRTNAEGLYELPIVLRNGATTPVTIYVPEQTVTQLDKDGKKVDEKYVALYSNTYQLTRANIASGEVADRLSATHLQIAAAKLYDRYLNVTSLVIKGKVERTLCNVAVTVTDHHKYALRHDLPNFLSDTEHGVGDAVVSVSKLGAVAVERERTGGAIAGSVSSDWESVSTKPVYMSAGILGGKVTWPSAILKHTSIDGGSFVNNLAAGFYKVTISHPTKKFTTAFATCENGRFVNVSPPQIHE